MDIWRVTFQDDDSGSGMKQIFHGNRSEAWTEYKKEAEFSEFDDPYFCIEKIRIPTDKAGLIKFLNAHCSNA